MLRSLQPVTSIEQGTLNMFPDTKLLQVPLPTGDAGIATTIKYMRMAANQGAVDPQVRQLALQIVRNVKSKDTAGEIQAVYEWVKANIRFSGERDETVQAPEVTIKFGAGDCDDHSVLMAALLGAIGYQAQFRTVAVHGEYDFTHVYARVLDPNRGWVAVDTTVDDAYPGWEPPDISRAMDWPALDGQGGGTSGLSGYNTMGRMGSTRAKLRGLRGMGFTIDFDTPDFSGTFNSQNGFPGGFATGQPTPAYQPPPPAYPPANASGSPGRRGGGGGQGQGSSVGGSFSLGTNAPAWMWPAVIGGGVVVLAVLLSRRGHR